MMTRSSALTVSAPIRPTSGSASSTASSPTASWGWEGIARRTRDVPGRGFAVVATEARNLAQRSATAATKIPPPHLEDSSDEWEEF